MPTQKADVGLDFLAAISAQRQLPEAPGGGRDLPDAFPFAPASDHRVVDEKDDDPRAIKGVVKHAYKVHRRVFTIYRPWEGCDRCRNDIGSGQVTLPPVGDYECPHQNKDEYEKVYNDILAGRLVLGSEQEIVQRDGSIVMSLRWFEQLPTKAQRRALAKAAALAEP